MITGTNREDRDKAQGLKTQREHGTGENNEGRAGIGRNRKYKECKESDQTLNTSSSKLRQEEK